MAPPPQLPAVDRHQNVRLQLWKETRDRILGHTMPLKIGIDYTSRHIKKIDGEGLALYQTILENPYDLAPRYPYCDWLREHGDEERADFIQWMMELRNYDQQSPMSPALRADLNPTICRQLLDKNLATWHGLENPTAGALYGGMTDLPYSEVNLYWRNGFVDSANFIGSSKAWFFNHLSTLVKIHPIRAVSFAMLSPLSIFYLIDRTYKRGDNLFGEVVNSLSKEIKDNKDVYFFENMTNFSYFPSTRKIDGQLSYLFQSRNIDNPCVLDPYLFAGVSKYGHKRQIHGCEFLFFDGQKNALKALSNGAIDCARSVAGLTPLAEHPDQVFNFKIDDPWFNPAMRNRLPYYRYPTLEISGALGRDTITGNGFGYYRAPESQLESWVEDAMRPTPPDWVRDHLGISPFVQTDDKKEGE